MAALIAGILGLFLAVITAFGLVTLTNNASAPTQDQANANIQVYGSN